MENSKKVYGTNNYQAVGFKENKKLYFSPLGCVAEIFCALAECCYQIGENNEKRLLNENIKVLTNEQKIKISEMEDDMKIMDKELKKLFFSKQIDLREFNYFGIKEIFCHLKNNENKTIKIYGKYDYTDEELELIRDKMIEFYKDGKVLQIALNSKPYYQSLISSFDEIKDDFDLQYENTFDDKDKNKITFFNIIYSI